MFFSLFVCDLVTLSFIWLFINLTSGSVLSFDFSLFFNFVLIINFPQRIAPVSAEEYVCSYACGVWKTDDFLQISSCEVDSFRFYFWVFCNSTYFEFFQVLEKLNFTHFFVLLYFCYFLCVWSTEVIDYGGVCVFVEFFKISFHFSTNW